MAIAAPSEIEMTEIRVMARGRSSSRHVRHVRGIWNQYGAHHESLVSFRSVPRENSFSKYSFANAYWSAC